MVVVTHNSASDLSRFLPGQLAAARSLEAPLVLVDNASSDGTLDVARKQVGAGADLLIIEMGRNAGYAAAVNAGFAATGGRDVLLLNPDVELAGGEQVRALAGFLAANPDLAVVAPRLVGDDGEPQASARHYPSFGAVLAVVGPLGGLPPIRRSRERYLAPSAATAPTTVDWVIGAAMLIRRQAYDAVGGWDERFFLYVEDTDFCHRCVRAGWRVGYVPSVAVRHLYPQASSKAGTSALRSRARRHHLIGFARLFAREPRLALGRGRAPGEPISDDPFAP